MKALQCTVGLSVAVILALTVAGRADEPLAPQTSWHLISGADTAAAMRGLWALAQTPKESVPLASEKLSSLLAGSTPERIAQLIEELDSTKFAVRARAARELELIPEAAAPHLQRVLNGKPSLELSRRVERLLASRVELDTYYPHRVQAARALALLESIGSPEALAVLEIVKLDGRESWLAQEAETALIRLKRAAPAPAETKVWEELAAPNVGMAARAFLSLSTRRVEGRATADQINQVVQLVAQVPPLGLKSRGRTTTQLPHELLPYRKAVLVRYCTDGKRSPLRDAVGAAVKVLQDNETRDLPIQEEFLAVSDLELPVIKRQIETIQKERVGEAIFQVLKAAEELETHQRERGKEPKLWQANYDYVLSRLYARAGCILEYSLMLGQIRRDNLPALDGELHKGSRLVPHDSISEKDARDVVEKARKLLQRLADEHRQTPWEVIARQEANASFGLCWAPLKK